MKIAKPSFCCFNGILWEAESDSHATISVCILIAPKDMFINFNAIKY